MTGLLLLLLAAGAPVGFALLLAGACGLWLKGGWPMVLGILDTAPLSSVSAYELITVPMFLLMAELVITSGLGDGLFRATAVWVGRIRGGLGIATAIAGAAFGAISGSSTAAAATLSATTIPAMRENGYEPKLAAGVVAISGTLAMLIPPSVALVLFGIIADVSIGQLLIGGVVPGILVALTIGLTVWLLVVIDPSRAGESRAYTWREKLSALRIAGPLALLFFAVTGVIYTGVATPTEAAGLGAFGALLLAWRFGKLTLGNVARALTRSLETTCMIFMIILGAKVFGYFLALTQATPAIVSFIAELDVSRWVILGLVLLGYVILGCFMDQIAILILTVPVVLPVVEALGFDPVWFGVIVIVLAEIGLVTPPVGLNVFVVARYTKLPVEEVFAGVVPHVVAHLLLVAALVAFPQLILWLPSTMR